MKSLSRVRLFATPWTVACQAPLSMGFSRQEYWSGLPFPSPGNLPHSGIEPGSPALEADALTSEPHPPPLFWFAVTEMFLILFLDLQINHQQTLFETLIDNCFNPQFTLSIVLFYLTLTVSHTHMHTDIHIHTSGILAMVVTLNSN